jgi:hypothetical protein
MRCEAMLLSVVAGCLELTLAAGPLRHLRIAIACIASSSCRTLGPGDASLDMSIRFR